MVTTVDGSHINSIFKCNLLHVLEETSFDANQKENVSVKSVGNHRPDTERCQSKL